MQMLIDFIIENIFIVIVLLAFLFSRIKGKSDQKPANRPTTIPGRGQFPERTSTENRPPFSTVPREPAFPRPSAESDARTPWHEQHAHSSPFPGQRREGEGFPANRPFPSRTEEQERQRSQAEQLKSLLQAKKEELVLLEAETAAAESEHSSDIHKEKNPYARRYEQPYGMRREDRSDPAFVRKAAEGMMWSQVYGPPRAKAPYQFRKY